MLRHIRDFYAQSAGKLKLEQDSTQIDNRKNIPKWPTANTFCELTGDVLLFLSRCHMGLVEEMSMSKIFLKFVNFRAFLVWENISRLHLWLKYCFASDLQYGNVSKILGDYKKRCTIVIFYCTIILSIILNGMAFPFLFDLSSVL